jgi:L-ribulose-5-phosphate 3-epimerase
MKLGIIQGRLSEPSNGFQECPENWQKEFYLLRSLNLSHIEWVVTGKVFWANPIFDISKNVEASKISSLCADFLVHPGFKNNAYINKYMKPLCDTAIKRGIKNITIPLMEDSSVIKKEDRDRFSKLILTYAKEYPTLNFSFEAELGLEELREILYLSKNFYVTYDTGNMTSHGVDHKKYIKAIGDRINNVHLKDRTYDAVTVPPGTGDTDFKLIFKKLKKIGYNGNYTIQTARGESGREMKTIAQHKKYFQELYNGE